MERKESSKHKVLFTKGDHSVSGESGLNIAQQFGCGSHPPMYRFAVRRSDCDIVLILAEKFWRFGLRRSFLVGFCFGASGKVFSADEFYKGKDFVRFPL